MRIVVAVLIAVSTMLTGCSQSMPPRGNHAEGSPESTPAAIEQLVSMVRADPAKKPLLARSLMNRRLLMIPDPHAAALAALPFYQNERSFIPIFSDRAIFDEEAYGTGFEGKAIPVDGGRFASLLKGDEMVILNPGHRPAIEFAASELKSSAARSR